MELTCPEIGIDTLASPPVAALEVRGIGKTYTKQSWLTRRKTVTRALDNVSFAVRPGETLGLLGPNGAGKTTTLKIISHMLTPTSGQVLMFGRDVAERIGHSSDTLGLVTCDERSFYWRLTGRQNLEFFAALYKVPADAARQRIAFFLDALGLTYAADRPYASYSSGMMQKMSIARGLLSNPRIVLYDEPTRSLDPLSAQSIRAWILENKRRNPSQASILATNLLNEAELLCDRIVIINRGQLIDSGTIAEVRARWDSRETVTHRIEYQGPIPAGLIAGIQGVSLVDHALPTADAPGTLRIETAWRSDGLSRVLSKLLSARAVIQECHTEVRPFDEVFCSMVTHQPEAGGVR